MKQRPTDYEDEAPTRVEVPLRIHHDADALTYRFERDHRPPRRRPRAAAVLLLLVACAAPPATTTRTVTDESTGSKCDPPNYPCNPMDPSANGVCEWICGSGEGGAGHCMPYTAVDDSWCAHHPDSFLPGLRYCDPWGNPTWETHCVPGWLP